MRYRSNSESSARRHGADIKVTGTGKSDMSPDEDTAIFGTVFATDFAAANRTAQVCSKSGDPDAGVAKHPHPGTVFTPARRVPGHLDCAKDALGVRHHYRDPAVVTGESRQTVGRSIRVFGIFISYLPIIIDVAHDHKIELLNRG